MWIYILAAVIILAITCVLVIYHDTHNFVMRSYDISSEKVSGDYTFVLLSDLHGYIYGDNNDRLLEAIDKAKPDAILCSGDMFTAHVVDGDIQYEPGRHVLTELAKKYPVYAGNGNHEHKIKTYTQEFGNQFDRYRSSLQKAGVITLENSSIDIPGTNIRVTGLDLNLEYFRKVVKKSMDKDYIDKLVGHSEKSKFQVLIAHNPQYFENYARWGADLSVSGHVHGGIIRLPFIGGIISPSIALFPKYDGGKYEFEGKNMILSRGLGTHSIHVRFLNPGEADVIRIHKI